MQFEIIRAGATTVVESSRAFLYNASKLPYSVQSTTTHKRLNALCSALPNAGSFLMACNNWVGVERRGLALVRARPQPNERVKVFWRVAMPLNPANWPYGNVEEARLATGVKQARVAASNSADPPFFPKMILLTAASALTVTKLDGNTLVYNSGDLAPNVGTRACARTSRPTRLIS